MATLVLSTVGTILGGPIGGAIGSLVGQSIDQQIFSSPKRGPRLGDLAVQTSSYGTQIPRIYGSMRVAGSVVWATDLAESAATSGAKGQPDVTYSYSVSFAVALSSRIAGEVGRIWADGKLLRGAAGDFKVSCEFRFYDGGEGQPVDPLIASVEGIDTTPAYRGLALAVFENLELAEYGNRIPFLTFEVIADADAPTVGDILADASARRIDCESAVPLTGYAALGRSIAAAVEPLIEHFGVPLFDDGEILRSPDTAAPLAVGESDFGNSADDRIAVRIEREQLAARTLPTALSLTYYDQQRDYQSGLVRTSVADLDGNEEQDELPAVLGATDARALVEDSLARRWAERDKLILRLPPRFMGLEPGSVLEIDLAPSLWEVRRCTIEAMVALAELRPAWRIAPEIAAESGRASSEPDIVAGPVALALIDAPLPIGEPASGPTLYLAASTPTAGWKAPMVEISASGFAVSARASRRKAVLGQAISALGGGQPYLLDNVGSLEVQLIDEDQWLTSCTDDALVGGANLALLGSELIQFGVADPIGPGQFRLSRLLRGRLGTEWAMAAHSADDPFVLVEAAALQPIALPSWTRDSSVTVAEIGGSGVSATTMVGGESLRPLSPVDLSATFAGGALSASWTRRSRDGFAWVDDVDAPLGEPFEQYAVSLVGPAGTIERETQTPALALSAAELVTAGGGPATLTVRQIGGWAASRPAQISLTLP
jgi:hypothetical protein